MTGVHEYLSTACFHDRHEYCQGVRGYNEVGDTWVKRPAQCKFCDSACVCACHREGDQ